MDIKLTKAQIKLITALRANPKTDAKEHLKHIRNQAIADDMIEKLLKFGILQENPETGQRELASAYLKMAVDFAENEETTEETAIEETDCNKVDGCEEVPEPCKEDKPRKMNKKAIILEMLMAKASLKEMMDATGWLEKSVRGVISQLKKEKKLDVRMENSFVKSVKTHFRFCI